MSDSQDESPALVFLPNGGYTQWIYCISGVALLYCFVGRLMSILEDEHASVRQKLQAKKTQIALSSSEAFRTPANETAEKTSDYVNEANYARKK